MCFTLHCGSSCRAESFISKKGGRRKEETRKEEAKVKGRTERKEGRKEEMMKAGRNNKGRKTVKGRNIKMR